MNKEAENFYKVAEESYERAEELFKENKYYQSVDKFYDSIENILKCLLILYEIPFSKDHYKFLDLLPEVIKRIPEEEPNKIYYGEIVLPPFIAIHKMLKSIRNLSRYPKGKISQEMIINEGIAIAVKAMLEYNYGSLKMWIVSLLYRP